MKIILIILLILLKINSFSQNVTETQSSDTLVKIPKSTAKLIIKDLLRGDMYRLSDSIKNNTISFYENRINSKDSLLDIYRDKEYNYLYQIDQYKDKDKINQDLVKQLNKDLKKQKRKSIFRTVGEGAIIGFLTYLLIKK